MNCTKCNQETGSEWKTLCLSCWRNRTPVEVREYRQAKLDKKVARIRGKAERLMQQSEEKCSALDAYRGDTAFFTQPNVNTSRGRAFSRYRERLNDRYDKGVQLYNEATELQEKAEWMEKRGAVVKGDAERRRQEKREKADTMYKVGSKVNVPGYGAGEIIKVNKKTSLISSQCAKGGIVKEGRRANSRGEQHDVCVSNQRVDG